ncbi:MAG: nitroreductase family protein [Bacillota bacterium]
MDDAIQVIKRRRSIRKYKPDPIPDEALQTIVECGLLAPSAINQQKWHFSVVQGPIIEKMAGIMRERWLKSGNERLVARAKDGVSPFHGAPALIIITGDPQARWIQVDCGCAVQNLALAAEALGIGSCVMAAPGGALEGSEGEEIKKALGIPEGYAHMISMSLGYKDCETPAPHPRKPDLVSWVK